MKTEQEVAEELAELMGYPATSALVLERLNKKLLNPNLIDAMWVVIKRHLIEESA